MLKTFPLLLLVGAFAACPSSSTPVSPDEGPVPVAPAVPAATAEPAAAPVSPEAAKTAAAANNAFGFALYDQLRAGEGNRFFSPISLSIALSMTTMGAAGKTEAELRAVLHLPAKGAYEAFGALQKGLGRDRGTEADVRIANRLWGQQGYAFQDAFLNGTKERFGAGLEPVDFATPEAARATINRWVSDATLAKIPELLPPGILTDQTKLVLTNAVYFKGTWETEFKFTATRPTEFSVTPERKVEVPMMHRTGRYDYVADERVQVLRLPYGEGAAMSMVVVLPKAVDGLPAVEATLAADLPGWLDALETTRVGVYLPRFEMRANARMNEALQALGVKEAFTLAADFSPMSGTKDLYLSAVVHEAYVKVDESGTEAAAATGVVMATKSAVLPAGVVFRADHPFFFAIRDDRTGALLFVGRVADPTAG